MDSLSLHDDTICAVATPIGEGGIGIVRISGPKSLEILLDIFRPHLTTQLIESHRLYHGWIVDPVTGERVDEVLASWMQAPRSYTREDVVEINSHSGYGVLDRLVRLALSCGARVAEPGEFTRRAFMNGRIDLSQAEAVIEIIRCRSEEQLRQATRQLGGGLRELIETLRERMLSLQARIEAFIDFADDVDESDSPDMQALFETLEREILSPLQDLRSCYHENRILREGLTLVLAGKPNVGKSSLLNALLGRERAIVTPHPGTTRDVIEDAFILSGVTIRVLDTAGLRPHGDSIESLGMAKTRESFSEADLVLWLFDGSRPLDEDDDSAFDSISDHHTLIILNKTDLPLQITAENIRERYGLSGPSLSLSILRDSDLEVLKTFLKIHFLEKPLRMAASGGIIPNLRQKECLDRAVAHLQNMKGLVNTEGVGELASLELGIARREIENTLGWGMDDALLDRIFEDFCIGK